MNRITQWKKMKKLLILTALFVCPLQQIKPFFSNGTNAILYGLGSVAAGVGTYLSYRQAAKIAAAINNPEELAQLSQEEIEKMRNQLPVYYGVTGGCAATALMLALLACKSCYGWATELKLNKLVDGKRVKLLIPGFEYFKRNEEFLLNKQEGTITKFVDGKKETTVKINKVTKKLRGKLVKDKNGNTEKYKKNKEKIDYLMKVSPYILPLILPLKSKAVYNPESMTLEELIVHSESTNWNSLF
jgi:hypothetical protein